MRHGAIIAFLFVIVVMRLRKIHHKIVLFLPSTAKSTTTLSVNVSVPGAQPQMGPLGYGISGPLIESADEVDQSEAIVIASFGGRAA